MTGFRQISLILLAGLMMPGEGAAKPERIVSMNLCSDQLAILLADRDRIRSVSYLADDPQASALAGEAASIPVNHGLTEEILPLEPDLVLAGSFTTRPTVFLLRKLGYRVIELPVAASLHDVRANIRIVAEAVDERERGEALIAAMDDGLPLPAAQEPGARPLAALYWANGYTSGRGTLANAAVEAAGFRTLGAELGLNGTGQLPLESLIVADPDLLIIGREGDSPALAGESFRHPALQRAFEGRIRVSIPDYLWVCGTPMIAEAVERLLKVRALLSQRVRTGTVEP